MNKGLVVLMLMGVLQGCSNNEQLLENVLKDTEALKHELRLNSRAVSVLDERVSLLEADNLALRVALSSLESKLGKVQANTCTVAKKQALGRKLATCAARYENPAFALGFGKCYQEQLDLAACG